MRSGYGAPFSEPIDLEGVSRPNLNFLALIIIIIFKPTLGEPWEQVGSLGTLGASRDMGTLGASRDMGTLWKGLYMWTFFLNPLNWRGFRDLT